MYNIKELFFKSEGFKTFPACIIYLCVGGNLN